MLNVLDVLLRIITSCVMLLLAYMCIIDYKAEKERERKIALKLKAQRIMRERGMM